ncbi:MAG: hypothetical protein ABW095_01660 [Candidatus Thiodiazotropha sp.]
MLRAEEWAKSHKYFEFKERATGGGYDFIRLANYDQSINGSIAAVKPYQEKIEKILRLLLPMNTQEAEVFTTVYAAWNNLILDKTDVTDETIIREARENWHSSKMNIQVSHFSEAINKIRTNGLIPDGTAKRVAGQESLCFT